MSGFNRNACVPATFEILEPRRFLSGTVAATPPVALPTDLYIVSAPDVERFRPNGFLYSFNSTPHIHQVAHAQHVRHVRAVNHDSK